MPIRKLTFADLRALDDTVEAVLAFKPEVTYVYQYNSTRTPDELVRKIESNAIATTMIARDITQPLFRQKC
jgi:hypothetical protein